MFEHWGNERSVEFMEITEHRKPYDPSAEAIKNRHCIQSQSSGSLEAGKPVESEEHREGGGWTCSIYLLSGGNGII